MKFLFLLFLLFSLTPLTRAQSPAPQKKKISEVTAADVFNSPGGRFSIALPAGDYESEATDTPAKVMRSFTWDFRSLKISVIHYSFKRADFIGQPKTFIRQIRSELLQIEPGKIISEVDFTQGKYSGLQLMIRPNENSQIVALLFVGISDAFVVKAAHEYLYDENEFSLQKVGSFHITGEPRFRSYEVPNSLPQTPAQKRAGSDLSDEGLKGKVQKITEEWEFHNSRKTGREIFITTDYDRGGNRERSMLYDSTFAFMLTFYGYAGGGRVYRYKYLIDRSTGAKSPDACRGVPLETMCYDGRHVNEYDKFGRLSKKTVFIASDKGRSRFREAYSYTGKAAKQLTFYNKARPDSSKITTYDENGNPVKVEESRNGTAQTFISDVYTYESFDSQGNWTKRFRQSRFTESSNIMESFEYRTITYYK